VALPAAADDTERRLAAARQVVALMNEHNGPEQMMGAMKAAMRAPLEQQLRSATHLTMAQRDRAANVMSAALTEGLGEVMGRVMPEMNAAMTRFTSSDSRWPRSRPCAASTRARRAASRWLWWPRICRS
jgi:hypothetical protein